jgi:hypothetical protein
MFEYDFSGIVGSVGTNSSIPSGRGPSNTCGSILNDQLMGAGNGNTTLMPLPIVCTQGKSAMPYRRAYTAFHPHLGLEHVDSAILHIGTVVGFSLGIQVKKIT